MDRITVGDARASSGASAHAIGAASESAASSDNVSVAGGSPIAGAPFVNYAASQGQAAAGGAITAQADGGGKVFVGGGASRASADATAGAHAAGHGAQARITIQLHGISTPNGTDLVFGSVGATACCGPPAQAHATADSQASGPYVRHLLARRVTSHSGPSQDKITFAAVSSVLPILDPSLVAAAMASAIR